MVIQLITDMFIKLNDNSGEDEWLTLGNFGGKNKITSNNFFPKCFQKLFQSGLWT